MQMHAMHANVSNSGSTEKEENSDIYDLLKHNFICKTSLSWFVLNGMMHVNGLSFFDGTRFYFAITNNVPSSM